MTDYRIFVLVILIQNAMVASSDLKTCDDDIPSRQFPSPGYFAMALLSDVQESECGPGEYFDWYSCKTCEDGTFMTQKMAADGRYFKCSSCYEPDEAKFEILAEPCTKTRDATILCEDGYYRSHAPGKPCQSECARCDVCGIGIYMFMNYEGRECHGDQNTMCCPHKDMAVEADVCVAKTSTDATSEPSIKNTIAVVATTTSATSIHLDTTHIFLFTFEFLFIQILSSAIHT